MITSDVDILARTVYGEARGEDFIGRRAVAHVVLNRVAAKHRSESRIAGAATEPWQFSCWNPNDPNVRRLELVTLDDAIFRQCWIAALYAIEEHNNGVDPTAGALHYHTVSVDPHWAEGKTPCAAIGAHLFYNDID